MLRNLFGGSFPCRDRLNERRANELTLKYYFQIYENQNQKEVRYTPPLDDLDGWRIYMSAYGRLGAVPSMP